LLSKESSTREVNVSNYDFNDNYNLEEDLEVIKKIGMQKLKHLLEELENEK